ncbi:MAG TPA: hypothetical protein VFW63_05200 [Acidimicrobiales bacterium]|nr:hypothetical protein [Acidimicrobiales bacterium]
MNPSELAPHVTVTSRALRPLLGGQVVVRTASSLWHATLLSCVEESAWLVVDDTDVVVHLGDILWVHAA